MASFRKKGTGWNFRVSYQENGKYKTKEKGGFRTKREAQLSAAIFEQELEQGINSSKKEMLFADYYLEWMNTFKIGNFSLETDNNYQTAYKLICEYFPNIKVKDLDRTAYQKFLNKYSKNHAYSTVRKVNSKISACFKDAVHEGHMVRLPSYKAKLSGKDEKDESSKYLDESDLINLKKSIVSSLDPLHTSGYVIMMGIATGARIGEILGLTYDSFDFKNNKIKISKSFDYKYTQQLSKTKTKSSIRSLTVDSQTMSIMKKYMTLKKVRSKDGLVFTDFFGNVVTPNAVNKYLKTYLKKSGIEKQITFHGLRHTHGSILLLHGASLLYVSDRLGHSNMETTSRIYSHLLKELKDKDDEIMLNSLSYL